MIMYTMMCRAYRAGAASVFGVEQVWSETRGVWQSSVWQEGYGRR